jgi:hypothetical protein
MVLLNPKWHVIKTLCFAWKILSVQGHHEHTKDHHNIIYHLEIKTWHDHWKNLGFDDDSLISLGCQKQRGPYSNLHNFDKIYCLIKNYQQRLKSKMFKLENDITLLLVGCISFLKHKVQATRQHIKFPLLAPEVICDDKLKFGQG